MPGLQHQRGRVPEPVPDALTTFPTVAAGEERILVVQRGPTGDTNEDYDGDGNISDSDDACFPGNKANTAKAAGWDAILIVNRHLGSAAADETPYCGSGGYTQFVATACTTHEAGHEIFDDSPPEYTTPYDDEAEMANVGEVSPYKLDATGTFDGWGYMSMYSTSLAGRNTSCRSRTPTRSPRPSTRTTRPASVTSRSTSRPRTRRLR